MYVTDLGGLMAGSGRSEWERARAAQQREADRQAREAARQAKERQKADQAAHLAKQQQLAESQTAAVADTVARLDRVLLDALASPPTRFADLMVEARVEPFRPGTLSEPAPEPRWDAFAPVEPQGVGRWFGGVNRYQRELAAAQDRYGAAVIEHQRAEARRTQALTAAQDQHRRRTAAAAAKAAEQNSIVETQRDGLAAGQYEAAEWFVDQLLRRSRYPRGFDPRWQIAYRPENSDVVIEFELPPQDIVPVVREYRYVKARDAIQPVARPITEIRQRYARLLACIALRTLHEVFRSTPVDIVEAVVFNGRVSTVDRATGKKSRPHVISVEAERAAFDELVLAEVDPAACLKHLNALVSPNPYDLEAVSNGSDSSMDLMNSRILTPAATC